jgi:hypothetical protein
METARSVHTATLLASGAVLVAGGANSPTALASAELYQPVPTTPTVSFTGAPATAVYLSMFTVSATTNASTMAVITATGACTISGNTVTMSSGTGTCNLLANWAADSNYSAASATQSTTATRAVPTITWSAPATITLGTALSGTQLDATANVAGNFAYTPPAGTVLQAGTSTTDYTAATASVSITVNDNGNLTISTGQSYTFTNGKINGNVTMTGGTLVLNNSSVGGNIQMSGGSLALTNNSTVKGNLQITGGSTFSIGPGQINGNLQIQNIPAGTAQNQICGMTINGSVQFQNNGTAVLIGSPSCPGNTVGGNLQVSNNSAATQIYGDTVSGNLQVTNNTAATQVDDNKVIGNLQVQNNNNSAAVFSNTVKSNLQCSGNNNSLFTGGGNTAAQKQGQCASF